MAGAVAPKSSIIFFSDRELHVPAVVVVTKGWVLGNYPYDPS